MIRKPITSSHIKSIGWEASILEIEFTDGSLFHYKDVLESVWKQFESAESKGKHFARFIKPYYVAEKVETQ